MIFGHTTYTVYTVCSRCTPQRMLNCSTSTVVATFMSNHAVPQRIYKHTSFASIPLHLLEPCNLTCCPRFSTSISTDVYLQGVPYACSVYDNENSTGCWGSRFPLGPVTQAGNVLPVLRAQQVSTQAGLYCQCLGGTASIQVAKVTNDAVSRQPSFVPCLPLAYLVAYH